MRRINRCLNPKLIDLCQKSIKLEELSKTIYGLLPETLRGQSHVGSFNKGCLNLIASNAGWASQLRFAVPTLRDALRQAGFYQLTSIKITVSMELTESIPKNQPQSKALSSNARESIMAGAALCEYLPLQQALYHLADAIRIQQEPTQT